MASNSKINEGGLETSPGNKLLEGESYIKSSYNGPSEGLYTEEAARLSSEAEKKYNGMYTDLSKSDTITNAPIVEKYTRGSSQDAALGQTTPGYYAQPAYGVQPLHPISQPAYGVQPVPISQPAYGVPFVGPDINLSYEQLEENIATLETSVSTLKKSWDGETKKAIQTLENSWAGKDCAEYTKKLSGMDKSVQNTIAALELLLTAYKSARDMVSASQAKSVTAIKNI